MKINNKGFAIPDLRLLVVGIMMLVVVIGVKNYGDLQNWTNIGLVGVITGFITIGGAIALFVKALSSR